MEELPASTTSLCWPTELPPAPCRQGTGSCQRERVAGAEQRNWSRGTGAEELGSQPIQPAGPATARQDTREESPSQQVDESFPWGLLGLGDPRVSERVPEADPLPMSQALAPAPALRGDAGHSGQGHGAGEPAGPS